MQSLSTGASCHESHSVSLLASEFKLCSSPATSRLPALPELKWDTGSRRFNFHIASFLTLLDSMNSINKGFKKAIF